MRSGRSEARVLSRARLTSSGTSITMVRSGITLPAARVDGGAIEIAIAPPDCSAQQGRRAHFAHALRARGAEQEQFGLGAHLIALGIVDDDVSDLLSDLSPAGLASRQDLAVRLLK